MQNWDCILLEAYPCSSPHELRARVRYWIETLSANLNRIVPETDMPVVHRRVTPEPKQPIFTIQQPVVKPALIEEKYETCPCGSKARDFKHKTHITSGRHLNYLKSLTQIPVAAVYEPRDIPDKAIVASSSSCEIAANELQSLSLAE